MTDPANIASDLRVVLGRLVRRMRAERRELKLGQVLVLGRLDREGRATVSALAAAESVRPQSMAATVATLEAAGLVTRRPDPGDRRSALVQLTAEGRRAIVADRRLREGWLADAIERDLSPRERRVLAEGVELLGRLTEGPG